MIRNSKVIFMAALTDFDKKQIWEEVQKEFPNDAMMQEIHYLRLLHYHRIKSLSAQERLRFFGNSNIRKGKKDR